MNAESARKPESAGQRAAALQSVGMPASAAPVADAGTGSAATTSGALPADTTELEPYTRRPRRRRLLLIAGPLAVALGALLLWFNTGRYAGTEDAYVKADKVTISAQVAGPIAAVAVRENQRVRAGDELFLIDDRPYRIALAGADAELAAVATELDSIKASLRQKTEELRLAHTNRDFAAREFERQSELARKKLNSGAAVDEVKYKLDVALQQISVTEQARAQYLSRLSGNPELPLEQYPAYQAARAARDAAALDLEHTVVRAPFAGIASKTPQRGQFVAAGSAVMSVVGADDVWIEANYMETDLAHVRVGQPATVEIDSYPGREWSGRVQSISQATGAEFSVLPPQNASGNWVKITQRIPLRIAIEPRADDPPLRAGMTATVAIDTGDRHTLTALLGGPGGGGGDRTDVEPDPDGRTEPAP